MNNRQKTPGPSCLNSACFPRLGQRTDYDLALAKHLCERQQAHVLEYPNLPNDSPCKPNRDGGVDSILSLMDRK